MIKKIKQIISSKIYKLISNSLQLYLISNKQNIRLVRDYKSLFETVEYVDKYLYLIKPVDKSIDIHDVALSHVEINGYYMEFGVYKGKTINYIANKVKNEIIFGFDSFEGLPEFWRDEFDKGFFNLGNNFPQVNSNVKLIKGWFDQTLKDFQLNKPIAYLHIDCDLYSSTQTIFNYLGNHIISGTVIVFDEYFNYPGWQKGEYLAFKEFLSARKLQYEYISYCRNHEQVAIIIK